MKFRTPRELLSERHGNLEAVIFGVGYGHFGKTKPALRVTAITGPGLMDWHDVHFSYASTVKTLRARWRRIKAKKS